VKCIPKIWLLASSNIKINSRMEKARLRWNIYTDPEMVYYTTCMVRYAFCTVRYAFCMVRYAFCTVWYAFCTVRYTASCMVRFVSWTLLYISEV
jgi:hypothetical protein